eukprot:201573-Pleurochrysis_carterae.AAC.1
MGDDEGNERCVREGMRVSVCVFGDDENSACARCVRLRTRGRVDRAVAKGCREGAGRTSFVWEGGRGEGKGT